MVQEPRKSPAGLIAAGALLAAASGWAAFSGIRLGTARAQAQSLDARLERVQALMEDKVFRERLAAALEARRQDAIPFRQKLKGLADRVGIQVEGSITESQATLASQGLRETTAVLVLKEVSLAQALDYGRTVELEIPEAVVSEMGLTPVKDAGDRWTVRLKISRRLKLES